MVAYIINVTIVWLTYLLLYELFLRKEHFHQANRFYLLASMVLGLLLPTTSISRLMPVDRIAMSPRATQIYSTVASPLFAQEHHIAPAAAETPQATPPQPLMSATAILWSIYLIGVFIFIFIIALEAIKLRQLYVAGKKHVDDRGVLVETGKSHGPFSFFNIVFVKSRGDYNAQQWQQILRHEREHGSQWHSADNLVILLLRAVFWFHPLPHIYHRRLRLVHEFQADEAASETPSVYGAFLLEQHMLQGTPMLAHSFYYSPLKIRIAMLTTTKKAGARRFKFLLAVPMLCVLVMFCTQPSKSGERTEKNGNVHFNGNEIEFAIHKVYPAYYYQQVVKTQQAILGFTPQPDSIIMKTNQGEYKAQKLIVDTTPVTINGEPIFGDDFNTDFTPDIPNNPYTPPAFIGGEGSLDAHLFAGIRPLLSGLGDGIYVFSIPKLVIDSKGKVGYYQSARLSPVPSNGIYPVNVPNRLAPIDRKINELMEGGLQFQPAQQAGRPVHSRVQMTGYEIEVKNGVASLVERKGC
jgi:beta-lactamase regulating signal transducer with metallopeptidase domain